jgi:hypothetical protein
VEAFRAFVRGEWLGETRRMEGWVCQGSEDRGTVGYVMLCSVGLGGGW